eukprot:COSAG01_NODE_4189_length_5250_cov_12.234735_3_plen_107_part_00
MVPCSCDSNAIKKFIETPRPAQTYFLLGATVGGTVGYGLYVVLLHRWKLGDGEPKKTPAQLKKTPAQPKRPASPWAAVPLLLVCMAAQVRRGTTTCGGRAWAGARC